MRVILLLIFDFVVVVVVASSIYIYMSSRDLILLSFRFVQLVLYLQHSETVGGVC